MAPRPSMAARRTTVAPSDHVYELGVVGRKTGVTVPDSGLRDEHGMEPLDNLFSSPSKSEQDEHEDVSVEEGSGDEAMDITATSGFGPATLINGQPSRLPMPASQRVRSPAKGGLLNSPAQRNRLIARNSSSPARGAVVRDDAPRFSSQPAADTTKRKLDFRSVANGGPHSLSQPARTDNYGAAKSRFQSLQQHEDEDHGVNGGDHYGDDDGDDDDDDEVNNFVEESMAMLDAEVDEPEQQEAEDEDPPAPAARKQPGRPPKNGSAQAKSAAAPPKAGKPAAKAPPQPAARGSKKRRSLDEDEAVVAAAAAAAKEPSPAPQPKRQRTDAASTSATSAAGQKRGPKKPSAAGKKAAEPAAAPKPRGRKRQPSVDPGDVSQVAVAPRPPLPKSRGLLINRREVPGVDSNIVRTRSGRTSYRPLAYWRNEHVEFEKDEAEDAFLGRKHKGRFVLPSVKEVVRVDEPEPERTRSRSRRGGAGGGGAGGRRASGKGGRRRRSSSGYDEEHDDDDDGPAEAWELDPGTVTGEVVVWQPEYEYAPPAPNDLVSVMDKQLAISGAAIKTTEVVGGEFRYAKVFSEGFIGAGVVDLPPGAVKRLKNSRKVFMIFFVHQGRVLVTVQETSFRIGRGGIFIVPRYNEYTIQNDYDRSARIFFAQGQEVAAQPPPPPPSEPEDADEEVEVSEVEEEEEEEE
ncbi:hypothetical protein VTJ83DRAFT_6240 [Remersonia thermophila]|uniref:Mif2/CENP-C cupin domain-containing protein n=1 Tax=Remersonia thermophila TaxID=72144 RepID=A0ABR4D524_9PEZI